MPSKTELKNQVKDLTVKLRETTEGIKKVAIIGTPDKGKELAKAIIKSGAAEVQLPPGNPIACANDIRNLEADIASGKTFWEVSRDLFDRGEKGIDGCLPCLNSYVDLKEAIRRVGEGYVVLPNKEWLAEADIAASVHESADNELSRVKWESRELKQTCGIKITRVLEKIKKMFPLAQVGNWKEFMRVREELLTDFENDIADLIPEIKIEVPTKGVPGLDPLSRYEKIKAGLTEDERKALELREEKEKTHRVPSRWAAYKCPLCSLKFETISGLQEHKAKHAPYPCPKCSKGFWTLEDRINHIMEKHPKEIKMPVKEGA